VTSHSASDASFRPDHEIAIIGAGFSGIGAGIKLDMAGHDDWVILERESDIGGTWRDNRYPGIAVDIPSFSYQYSFELNPDWSRVFAPGREIKEYADHCVSKYGLRDRIRLNTGVADARFDEARNVWRLRLEGGGELSCRWLITALGGLTQPKLPDIEGLDSFKGKTIHTARWDHDHDLTGERVAVIGTGATAVQLVPKIAERTERLYVYQRTPIWVMPKVDAPLGPVKSAFRHVPGLQNALRLGASAAVEAGMVVGIIYNRQLPLVNEAIKLAGKAFLRTQVPDPVLREQLTPDYGFGCKRPSVSNSYHRTFNRDDTHLVVDPIESITPNGIRTADGVEREIDTLILATGFFTTEPENAPSMPIKGRGGRDLGEFWREKRFQAYEGITVPGFPNSFAMFGPYAFTGSSWMFMVENQIAHAIRVIEEAKDRDATCVEVTEEANQRFFEEMLRRQRNVIFFNNNCEGANSYYFDMHGDAPFLRPATALETWWHARNSPLSDYEFSGVGVEAPDVTPAKAAAR
jgi:cation diffusion facilitator CzcD-associated flavoprotein CzcO